MLLVLIIYNSIQINILVIAALFLEVNYMTHLIINALFAWGRVGVIVAVIVDLISRFIIQKQLDLIVLIVEFVGVSIWVGCFDWWVNHFWEVVLSNLIVIDQKQLFNSGVFNPKLFQLCKAPQLSSLYVNISPLILLIEIEIVVVVMSSGMDCILVVGISNWK